VVATLGTACTATHVQKLSRQTDHVIFSFDGDGAGRRAARRALEASLPYAADNKTIKFLFLPSEHDPDSYVREFGAAGFEKQVQDAMPLSQFLINAVTDGNDLSTSEGRARTQFDAKPLLQAMPASSLRLQIVRSLAQLTQTTPTEIEALFELSSPVGRSRMPPPRSNRTPPIGLELQIMRLLVAHPILAAELDHEALAAMLHFVPDNAAMLTQLVDAARQMGDGASFAMLAEHLRASSGDFDAMIAEIAAGSESELDAARLELFGAIRQTRLKIVNDELKKLADAGVNNAEALQRYREFTQKRDALKREAEDEIARR
jgi:DNA primase